MMPIRFNSASFVFSTATNLNSVLRRAALVAISFRFLAVLELRDDEATGVLREILLAADFLE